MADDALGGETDLIQRYFAPLAQTFPGAFGLADDAAALTPPPGFDLIVTTDAVVAGVHCPHDEEPDAIAWKALAVNVSDLAAKGATPYAYLLSLALSEHPSAAWLEGFADGLRDAQERFGCVLAGGDTDRTPGPPSASITAFGLTPHGAMVRRSTAKPGDLVYVTGCIGDAHLGLRLLRRGETDGGLGLANDERAYLENRQRRPSPVIGFETILREHATAALDVSDGLLKDFQSLCRASGAGGVLDSARVPVSPAARSAMAALDTPLTELLSGGEDYEILLTVARDRAPSFEDAARAKGVSVTRIGDIREGSGVSLADGAAIARTGWDHFGT